MTMDVIQQSNLKLRIVAWGLNHLDGLPVGRFADACRINRGTMSQYCNGKSVISAKHLMIMADMLDCNPSDLVGWS